MVARYTADLLSVTETCRRLGGIHRSTLDRYRKAGRIIATPIGGRVMYSPEDIDRFIEAEAA